MDFEIAIYLTAILEVVTLICFFVLCSNVSNIKNKISKNGITSSTMFALYIGMGEKEKAKLALMEMILADTIVQNSLTVSAERLKAVMGKYNKMMKEVGLEFDAEKAFEAKRLF